MRTPSSSQEVVSMLSETVQERSDGVSEGKTAIMAGHQVVATSDSYVDLGVFPERTWAMGWEIVGKVRDSVEGISIFSLINDWQCLQQIKKEGMNVADVKEGYWNNRSMVLNECEDVERKDLLLPGFPIGTVAYSDQMHRGRMSESRLQNRFSMKMDRQRDVRKKIRDAMEDSGMPVGNTACHIAGCTSEYLELVPYLWSKGYTRLISFIPSSCRGFISAASQLLETGMFNEENTAPRTLHNVYLSSGFMASAMKPPQNEVELFSDGSYECYRI